MLHRSSKTKTPCAHQEKGRNELREKEMEERKEGGKERKERSVE